LYEKNLSVNHKRNCGGYIGLVGANILIHGYEAWNASRESQKAHYGNNLRQQWGNHSNSQLERLADTRILIPLSSYDQPGRPLKVEMIGEGTEEIQIQIDVENNKSFAF